MDLMVALVEYYGSKVPGGGERLADGIQERGKVNGMGHRARDGLEWGKNGGSKGGG